MRRLQRLFPKITKFRSELSMPAKQAVCGGSGESKPLSILSTTKVPQIRNEP